MAIALVQQGTETGTSGTSGSPTLPGVTTAGSLVVLTCANNSAAVSAVSGFGVTTWAVAKAAAFSNYAADIWYGIVDGTPSSSGSVTLGGSTYRAISVSEWSGIDTGSPLLAQNDTDSGSSGTSSTGPITASSGPCLYVAVHANSYNIAVTGPGDSFAGLTQAVAGSALRNASAYRIDAGTPASATPSWTLTSTAWEHTVACFKGAATSAPAGPAFIGGGFF